MLYAAIDDCGAQKWRIGQYYRRLGVTTPITRSKITRIIVLQTPLAASLTAEDILVNYPRCLHCLNLLKVCLHHDNHKVSNVLASLPIRHQTKARKAVGMKKASGVVKRLNVAIQRLEERFTITKGACKILRGLTRQKNKVPSNHYAFITNMNTK
jgi:hypothetical protein